MNPGRQDRVLVAGASGMVGSAIVSALIDSDPALWIRGTFWNNRHLPPKHPRVEYVRANLLDPECCLEVSSGCSLAIMAAAHTGGASELTREPWSFVNANLLMNSNLLQALPRAGVSRAVIIGSATLYQALEGPVAEDDLNLNEDPQPPHFPIGWVTRFVEKLARFCHESTGIQLRLVRAANVFGPRAQFDPRKSNFIPALIRKAVRREDPYEVWGSPDVVRDVIFSTDFAEAIVRILQIDGPAFDTYNVGSGRRTTVGEVVQGVLRAADYIDARVAYTADGPSSIRARILDSSKVFQATGWTPALSLEEGLARTVSWWKDNMEVWSR